jgi:surface antigen
VGKFLNTGCSRAIQLTRVGSPSRERAVPTLARTAIASAVVAAFLLSPLGSRTVLANEDPRDRPYVMDQVNQALETQRTMVETRWSNPETGNGGTIVVDRTFYRDTGEPCRDYRRTLDRSGAPPLVIEGTGCRISPARWEIVEKTPAPPERSRTPTPGTKKGARDPAPAEAKKPTPKAAPAEKATAVKAPVCPDPAALGPPFTVVKAPCAKPAAFTDYTLPSKAEL